MIIEYDEEVTIKPEHLKVDFYKEIVQNALSLKNVEVVKVFCCMGSKPGENFCSAIYRAKIQYKMNEKPKVDEISIIMKSMPKSGAADFLEPLETFKKERIVYYKILPRLEALLSTRKQFGPRIYHHMEEPVKTLIFEDLAVSNFKMASREQGLDEMHARLILKQLAQLHASSMVLLKEHPETPKSFNFGMLSPVAFENESGMFSRFFSTCAQCMIAEATKWPGYESIVKKLQKYASDLGKNLAATQAPTTKDKIIVLNHGDLWVNNTLFAYDAKGIVPINVVFVDFQMSFYASPGIDLNYFFYTSLQLDLLKSKRNELLAYYHHELCSALEDLVYVDVKPTLQQVLDEFEQRALHGFFASFCILPTICNDKENSHDSSLENFMDENFMKLKIARMFQSQRVQDTLRLTLKEFDKCFN